MTFKEQVEKELEGCSKEEIRAFAWRCAVRALPFLGSKGHFDFWSKKERASLLYVVFYSLDAANAVAADYAMQSRILQDIKNFKSGQQPKTYNQQLIFSHLTGIQFRTTSHELRASSLSVVEVSGAMN